MALKKIREVVFQPAQRPHGPSHAVKEHAAELPPQNRYMPMHKSPRPISQGVAFLSVASMVSTSQSRKSHQKVAPISTARKRSCKRILRRVFSFHFVHSKPYYTTAAARLQRAATHGGIFNLCHPPVKSSRIAARPRGTLSPSGRCRRSRKPSPRRKGARRTSARPYGKAVKGSARALPILSAKNGRFFAAGTYEFNLRVLKWPRSAKKGGISMREMLYPDRLFDMTKSIAAAIFADVGYPWEVLPEIGAFVVKLGQSLSEEEYERAGKDVWIARDAIVAPTASITGPTIIDHGAEIRHCAFIRGKAVIGKNCVVGNSVEVKTPYSLTTRRCRTSITSATACSATARTWARARSRPTSRAINRWSRCARMIASSPPICANSAPCSATMPRSDATACSAPARSSAAAPRSIPPAACAALCRSTASTRARIASWPSGKRRARTKRTKK